MAGIKGIVLAGGLGSRLMPLTKVTNKCLLPIYDRPMIHYPIQTLVDSGIEDILLVCGGNAAGEFLRILGNGKQFGLRRLHYTYQENPGGIAEALFLARDFAGDDPITVILADNIYENPIKESVQEFEKNPVGGRIFLTQVPSPECYGCVRFDENEEIVEIVEKPKDPPSNWIATGCYMYDNKVWDVIKDLKPSGRGELEITDVNNYYLNEGQLAARKLTGFWKDAGESLDVYMEACIGVYNFKKMKYEINR